VDNPRAPLFAAIAAGLVVLLAIFVFVLPKRAQVTTAQEDLAAARSKGQSLETQRSALEDTKAEAPQNQQIIDDVHRQIPPTVDEPGLILLVHNAAINAGFDISQQTVNVAFDETTGLSIITLSVSAVGTYNDVTQFSYAIETLPRAAKITSLSLTGSDATDTTGSPLLTATFEIEAFTSDTSAGPGSSPGPTEGTG
jgi:Tfp pilus assembly protein PilO